MNYKLRAECLHDINALMAIMPFKEFKVIGMHAKGAWIPDVELEFTTPIGYRCVREAIASIPDCHVMLETLAPLESYTGERKK